MVVQFIVRLSFVLPLCKTVALRFDGVAFAQTWADAQEKVSGVGLVFGLLGFGGCGFFGQWFAETSPVVRPLRPHTSPSLIGGRVPVA